MRQAGPFYGWIILGASAAIVAMGLGTLFCLAWLFLSSAAIGIAATFLALTFRPFARTPVAAVAVAC